MQQVGVVSKVFENNKCELFVSRISGCKGTCKTCSGCPTPEMKVVLENRLNVSVGDTVKIGVDNSVILKYSIFLYGFPLFIFILSISLINIFFVNIKNIDVISFGLGILFTFFAFLIVKYIDKKYAHLSTKAMYMEKIISRR